MNFSLLKIYQMLPYYFLVFIRVSSFFAAFPMFSMTTIPKQIIVLFSFAMSIMFFEVHPVLINIDLFSLKGLEMVANQVLLGVAAGFVFTIIFNIFIYFGEITAMQTGLGFATLFDPHISQMNLLGQFYWLTIATLFLLMNGHLEVIQMLFESFRIIPVTATALSMIKIKTLIDWSAIIFSGSILISLPMIIALLSINIVFAVMTRAVPQLNLFSIVMPIVLLIGFIVIYITFRVVIDDAPDYFEEGFKMMKAIMNF